MYIFKNFSFSASFLTYFFLFSTVAFCEEKVLPEDMEWKDTTLNRIVQKLEKYFSVNIEVDKEESDPIDLYFVKGQPLEEMLKMLAEITEKKLEKVSETEYLLKAKVSPKAQKTKEYVLAYLAVEEAVKVLQDLYQDKVKCAGIASKNKLIVVAEETILEELENVMKEVDLPQRQVKIQSQILDISKDLFHELGFDWLYDKPGIRRKHTSVSLLSEESSGDIAPVAGSRFSLVRQFSNATEALGLSFRLLEAKQDLRVSSSPSLVISNGAKGEFKITEEVIVGEKKEKKKGESTSVEPIFKEAGLILQVTPYIHEDLSVTLDIHLEVSDFKYRKGISRKEDWDFNSQGGSKIGRSLSTKVCVKNGETILIGGLRRSSNRKGENKVPFLGDLPVIQYLFRSESKREEMADMYIKIFVEVY